MKLNVKTKGNVNPQGMPRVLFTCHWKDFDNYFNKICEDIFYTHNCAIYYPEDLINENDEENRKNQLEQMNLIVVPVSYQLLTEPNYAMDFDVKFALEYHIPILPLLIEKDILDIYKRDDKFNTLQYLNMYNEDITAIGYQDKLKKYLDAVLIDDGTAQKIRAAFDTYIFLSYRKKDRLYANKLMNMIHSNPLCRDIAIWYDEYLLPGENFNESIANAMSKSEFFTLLVTPNLINEENYVQKIEYPMARENNMIILPVEMLRTDSEKLKAQYDGIKECVDGTRDDEFKEEFIKALGWTARQKTNDEPEHNFLIGLAYLDGIDVEINRTRAVKLITSSAEAELPEAMYKLADMYHNGIGIQINYTEWFQWRKRIVQHHKRMYGEQDERTICAIYEYGNAGLEMAMYEDMLPVFTWLYEFFYPNSDSELLYPIANNIAYIHGEMGNWELALEQYQQIYTNLEKLNNKNNKTLSSLSLNIASCYGNLGKWTECINTLTETYVNAQKLWGEDDDTTLKILAQLTWALGKIGEWDKAFQLAFQIYEKYQHLKGDEHPETIEMLSKVAYLLSKTDEKQSALELMQVVYEKKKDIYGPNHPKVLIVQDNIAFIMIEQGQYDQALTMQKDSYRKFEEILGKNHVETLKSMNNLAGCYLRIGKTEEALEWYQKSYEGRKIVLGKDHPETLTILNNIGSLYIVMEEYEKAVEPLLRVFKIWKNVYGIKNSHTINTLQLLDVLIINLNQKADEHYKNKDFAKALELYENVYQIKTDIIGNTHSEILDTLINISYTSYAMGNYQAALLADEKKYMLCLQLYGEMNTKTIKMLNDYAFTNYKCGYYDNAVKLGEKACQLIGELLGDNHDGTLTLKSDLAIYYEAQGDKKKALAICDEISSLQINIRPVIINKLISIYEKYNELEKAESLQKRC